MKTKAQGKTSKFPFLRVDPVVSSSRSVFSWCCVVILNLNLASFALCNGIVSDFGENTLKYANESLLKAHELGLHSTESGWSQFLEDYVLSQSGSNIRTPKDLPYIGNMGHMGNMEFSGPGSNHPMPLMNPMSVGGQHNFQQAPINYHSSAYNRPGMFITKRIGEEVELEPHMRPPIKVVTPQFRPMVHPPQPQQPHQPGFFQQLFGIGGSLGATQNNPPPPPQQQRPISLQQQQHHISAIPPPNGPQPIRAVSENDLYLLGAIEKLVYRVDYLESRVRRTEQLVYYLMAGNSQKEVRDPCPTNFTRISDNCYYINSHQQVNWKTANTACKALGAHLAEFERVSENEDIMAHLLNQPAHRGRDFWLGGLNPGLLWIWSNSAKPVNPNMNLTSIAMSHEGGSTANATETNTIDGNDGNKPDKVSNETILNNTVEIKGQGRCLRLSYNAAKHTYAYYGQECTSRHHYICEYEDKTLDNKIKKIARDLKLFD